jgi:hypothetical protein
MDKFLGTFDQVTLNQEDINHLSRSVTSNEIEAVIKSLPTKKRPGLVGFTTEFYQNLKEELISTCLKLFPELEREGTFIPKPDKDPTTTTKEL